MNKDYGITQPEEKSTSDSRVKILVKAPISKFSGYGNDGMDILKTLDQMGFDVYVRPSWIDPPLTPEVARLMQKELKAPFDIVIDHHSPDQLALNPETVRASTIKIMWSMWEWDSMLGVMPGKDLRTFRKRISSSDILLAYDEVSAQAFEEYLPKRNPPKLDILQGGFKTDTWKYVQRDWFSKEFNFFMLGALGPRKVPFASIQAFQELKAEYPEAMEHAYLHLKTNIPGLHSKIAEVIPGVKIYYDIWSPEIVRNFYNKMHLQLVPSLGEGKHLPSLEFQATGGVVAATNWGGPAQWLSEQYAYPLKYTLSPMNEGTKANCARVDKEYMKSVMLHAINNRGELKRKGDLAAQVIPQIRNWEVVVDNLMRKVKNFSADGAGIYNRYVLNRKEIDND